MSKLRTLLAREERLRAQTRKLEELRSEVEALRAQNERIKTSMRRCTSCEFRQQVIDGG